MDYTVIVLFGLFYAFFLLTFYARSKKVFLFIFIFLTLFHDYIFINLDYVIPSATTNFIVKSWQELLLVFLLVNLFFFVPKIKKNIFNTLMAVALLTLAGITISILNDGNFFEMFLGWRKFFLTLLNTFLLFSFGVFDDISMQFLFRVLTFFVFIIIAYATYQQKEFQGVDLPPLTNRGNDFYVRTNTVLQKFWFYDKFGQMHMVRSWPNFMRNESARLTSIFVSPIIFAEYLALMAVFYISVLIYKKNRKRILTILMSVFLLILTMIAMELSHTRIGYFQIAIGVATLFLLRARARPAMLWLVLLGAMATLLVMLSVLDIGDSSARGRLVQYSNLISLFKPAGYGFHSEQVSMYDSLYISIVLLFGVLSIVYFYIHFYWTQILFRAAINIESDELKLKLRTVAAIVSSFIFAFAFQFSIGSAPVSMLYLLLFWALAQVKVNEEPL